MTKIGILNNPEFPIDEWDYFSTNLIELFENPSNLSKEEYQLAHKLMCKLNLETDNNEGLIEIISRPSEFMNFLINVKRFMDKNKN
jgi:hypothetical protein